MGRATNVAGTTTVKSALKPAAQAAAAAFGLHGTGIDRSDYTSALLLVDVGAATGTPDSYTVDARIEDSADNSSFAAVATTPDNAAVAITQIVADNTRSFLALDLSSYRQYIRVSLTVAFVNGTSPKALISAVFVLGGKVNGKPTHA